MPLKPTTRAYRQRTPKITSLWTPLKRLVFFIANHVGWIHRLVNRVAINDLVSAEAFRPHRWSTVSDYTSWLALTDKTWSARLLPAYYPKSDLPDIKALAEFFRRPSGVQLLSDKSTTLFPAFAQHLTDGFIRTVMPTRHQSNDLRRRNTSNHEIDLCPLYGRTEAHTAALRLKSSDSGKKGRLKTQLIHDEEFMPFLFEGDGKTIVKGFEVLDPPLDLNGIGDPSWLPFIFAAGGDRVNASPQVAMMNTLWMREHNRLALEIERANSGWDDEHVFQVARNIVIAEYINVIVEDYINHISPEPFTLLADPSVCWDATWNKPNWITTEFSLLYRWHSLIPDAMKWDGVNYPVAQTLMNNQLLTSASLESAFVSLSKQKAGRLGAFNTSDALVPIEMNSILQGRVCNLAPYSDYRAQVKLARPSRFEDISKDGRVVDFLKGIYKSVDDVEFYVGLFAEDTVPNSPLPLLIGAMVAVDAFSQALPNPLLSRNVFREETFSKVGWDSIQATSKLEDVIKRNTPGGKLTGRISMTQESWKFNW